MPTTETTDQTPAVSTKRKAAAFATTTVVTVALGIGAQYLINKVQDRIQKTIIPENTNEAE